MKKRLMAKILSFLMIVSFITVNGGIKPSVVQAMVGQDIYTRYYCEVYGIVWEYNWGLDNKAWNVSPKDKSLFGDKYSSDAPKIKDVIIPSTLDGNPVASISARAFQNTKLESVIIPDSVDTIGEEAFSRCYYLTSVKLPKNLTRIWKFAFENCSISNLGLPDGLEIISDYAFWGNQKIPSIYIPKSVWYIGEAAFAGEIGLKEFSVSSENEDYKSVYGVLYSKTNSNLVTYPISKEGESYKILDGVQTIDEYAFIGCRNLRNVYLPEGVEDISENAFLSCTNLTDLNIPKSLTEIESYAFKECWNIRPNITIPKGVTSIGYGVFDGCLSLKEIIVEEGNEKYKSVDGVLYNKQNTELLCYPSAKEEQNYNILDGVQELNYFAFSDCRNLINLSLPEGIKTIGSSFS